LIHLLIDSFKEFTNEPMSQLTNDSIKNFFMRNYLRLSFLTTALIFAFGVFANAQTNINEILKRMDEHQKALSSLKASVMMDKYNVQLGESDIYEGNIKYVKIAEREANFRLDWMKPQEESLAVVGKDYILYRVRLNQYIQGKTDDAQKKNSGQSNMFDFVKMSKEQLRANYSVKFMGEEQVKGGIPTWNLELTPKTPKSYKSVNVWVDGNGMVLQTKVNENNGDSTTVYLSNLRKNENINIKNEIVVKLPPNAQKVKA
jgi:outer membrane lipoprotein-sorting protein